MIDIEATDHLVVETVKTFFYDLHLSQERLNDLPYYWQSIGKLDLSPSQLARILYNTALAIERLPTGQHEWLELRDAYGLRNFIHQNFASWLDAGQYVPGQGHSQDLAKVLKALRMLHIRPDPEWLREAENWMVVNIEDHSIKTLTECIDGFSHMAHELRPTTLDVLSQAVFTKLSAAEPRALVDLYVGAAIQEVLAGRSLAFSQQVHKTLNTAFSHLDDDDISRHFPADARIRLSHAELWFTGRNDKFPEKSVAKPARWKEKLKACFNDRSQRPTGVNPANRQMPLIKYETDLAFKIGERRVHLEADGSSMFNMPYPSGDPEWTGKAILQTAMMRRHYGNRIVLRLPSYVYHQARKQISERDIVRDLSRLMRDAANNTPANTPDTVTAVTFLPDTGFAVKKI